MIIPKITPPGWVRPGFVQKIKSAFWLGGYELVQGALTGIDLDEEGLDWVRVLNLRHQSGYVMQIIDPRDLHQIVGEYPSEAQVRAMYGYPGAMV